MIAKGIVMDNPIILIAEGDKVLCQDLKKRLLRRGFGIIEATGGAGKYQYNQNNKPDLIIIGADEKIDGALKEAKQIHQWNSDIPIVLITKHSSEEKAIAALRAGINDYLRWPMADNELMASVRRNLPARKANIPRDRIDQSLIGNSAPMAEVKTFLAKVAASDSTVLITGETGTGKELAAELIHRCSPRSERPFVSINCAALPESLVESEMFGYERGAFTGAITSSQGKFEQANGGTVLLDEIADMSLYAQAKILRIIERKEVNRLGGNKVIPLDVRITAATNRNLEQLVEERKFRNDLYYRINVARIHIPPLRDRKEDIRFLVNHSIRELNKLFDRHVDGLTDEAMESLLQYHWPGNVRELKNCLESTYINLLSRRISFMDFPDIIRKRLRFSEEGFTNERDMVLAALSSTNWNKTKAAKKLKCSRMKIYRTLKRHKINFAQEKP